MRHCAICAKTSIMAGTRRLLRGHYNPTNWSRKYPNLQKAKLPDGTRALVCTKCLKRLTGRGTPTAFGKKKAKVVLPKSATPVEAK